jgi:hypothetical protein
MGRNLRLPEQAQGKLQTDQQLPPVQVRGQVPELVLQRDPPWPVGRGLWVLLGQVHS